MSEDLIRFKYSRSLTEGVGSVGLENSSVSFLTGAANCSENGKSDFIISELD